MSLSSCATPTTPTGGPADKTGPKILKTYPKTGTTNFHGKYIEFYFSKFANRSSFRKAFHVEPNFGLKYKMQWGRKRVMVRFKSPLPDSTTVIFTIGTDFTDYYGNKIAGPFTLAMSTGPRINKGKIKGKILNYLTGKGKLGMKVLLYSVPIDLKKTAQYFAETDSSGTVTFSYLKSGKYMAFYLDDRNRNNKWDKKIEHAQPFNHQYVTLATDSVQNLGTLYEVSVDTVRPGLLGIGVLSTHRLRLRFSKDIMQTDSTKIEVTDTLGQNYCKAIPLYVDPKSKYVLFAHSEKALDKNGNYRLRISGLTDTKGNLLKKQNLIFQGSGQKDTTSVKIVNFETGKGIYPNQPIVARYNAILQNEPVLDSLKVVEGNKLIKHWKKARIVNNILYVYPDSLWQGGANFELRFYIPAYKTYQKYDPKVWSTSTLGSIQMQLADSTDTTTVYHFDAYNKEYKIRKDTTFRGDATVNDLPPIDYTIRIYADLNKNGKWDYGSVEPYVRPEPYFIQQKVPVKSKLTSMLKVDF